MGWGLKAGDSLLVGPASRLYLFATDEPPGPEHLTHFWFVPPGVPWELDGLRELHCGEDRLDRDCRGALLKQKHVWMTGNKRQGPKPGQAGLAPVE